MTSIVQQESSTRGLIFYWVASDKDVQYSNEYAQYAPVGLKTRRLFEASRQGCVLASLEPIARMSDEEEVHYGRQLVDEVHADMRAEGCQVSHTLAYNGKNVDPSYSAVPFFRAMGYTPVKRWWQILKTDNHMSCKL